MPTIININQGGTGETDIAALRTALGLGTAALYNVTSNPEQTGNYVPSISLLSDINTKTTEHDSFFKTSESSRVLKIANGGTECTTITQVKSKFGITDIENGTLKRPLGIASGGTGSSTSDAAMKAILPADNRQDGNVLQISGSNIIWSTPPSGASNVRKINLAGGSIGSGNINFNGASDVKINVQYIDPDYLNKAIPVNKGGTGTDNVATFKKNFGFKSGADTEIIVDSTEPDPAGYPDNTIWIQFTHEVSSI